jgi:hypothetical protein
MTEQVNFIIFVVDDKEYLCNNESELLAYLSNTEYTSRKIKFFKDKEYNEKISKFYNRKYNIDV